MNSNTPIPQLDKPHPATEAEKTEARLTRLETTMEQLVKVIDQMQLDMREGFRCVNARVDHAVTDFRAELHSSIAEMRAEHRSEMQEMRREMATHMRWLLGIIFTSFMSLLAMVARINNLL